uniref:Uncharacterized protein n=1 Tax=Anopheles darlingi TaxID=43151 RepID=A0A2M4DH97_ANODA
MLSRQNPGQRGKGGGVAGRLVVVTSCCLLSSATPVIQHESSFGQNASVSISSQNSASSPFTQSPSHSLCTGPWPLLAVSEEPGFCFDGGALVGFGVAFGVGFVFERIGSSVVWYGRSVVLAYGFGVVVLLVFESK